MTGADNTPFFILGAARSGTTMLRLMLNRHSRLAIPFESHFLLRIFPELPLDRPIEPHEAERMAHLVITEKNFPTWHLDPADVRRTLLRLAPAPLSVLVDALFRMEVARSGKPRWGDKTPPYYVCWRQLMALFPRSRLLHIVRDGRDVSLSLKSVGWHGRTESERAGYWLQRVEMAHAAASELGPERNLIVRYEDLVLETRATLGTVCEFLEESFEPAMLDFFEDAGEHMSAIDGDIHRKLHRPPNAGDVARWRREMPVPARIEFESVAGEALRTMRYPLSGGSDRGFDQIHQIYYGTDDGFVPLWPREESQHDAEHVAGLYEVFARFEDFYRGVSAPRRDRIHFASVVGGLYGLNLIPIFQPAEITFFDVNPYAVTYFNILRRVWIASHSAEEFLDRLARADYDAAGEHEAIIRRCIAAKQNRTLTEDQGRSARSFLSSWRYALDHFALTRRLLAEVPVHTRVEGMQTPSFIDFVANEANLWLYCSNVLEFVFFDLTFRHPENAAVFASYFDETDMADLGGVSGVSGGPATLRCRIPMTVTVPAAGRACAPSAAR